MFLYDVRLRRNGASKLPIFRILAYFPYTKPLKRTFWWPAYSPGLTSQNDFDFSLWWLKVQRGAFRRLLVGELETTELAQIFGNGKWLLYGASDLDERCLKTHNSEEGCTFPPNIFASIPKITPKGHFGGPFNTKPIIQIALRKSHVNGATKVKLYSYIGMGKYLGVSKFFRYRVSVM